MFISSTGLDQLNGNMYTNRLYQAKRDGKPNEPAPSREIKSNSTYLYGN